MPPWCKFDAFCDLCDTGIPRILHTTGSVANATSPFRMCIRDRQPKEAQEIAKGQAHLANGRVCLAANGSNRHRPYGAHAPGGHRSSHCLTAFQRLRSHPCSAPPHHLRRECAFVKCYDHTYMLSSCCAVTSTLHHPVMPRRCVHHPASVQHMLQRCSRSRSEHVGGMPQSGQLTATAPTQAHRTISTQRCRTRSLQPNHAGELNPKQRPCTAVGQQPAAPALLE
jgi:hypothetical protein